MYKETTVFDMFRIDIDSMSCTMMETCMNSISRRGKLPPPGREIMHGLEMTDGVQFDVTTVIRDDLGVIITV